MNEKEKSKKHTGDMYHVSLNIVDSVTNNGTVTLTTFEDINLCVSPFVS